jgi:hypothetical protein
MQDKAGTKGSNCSSGGAHVEQHTAAGINKRLLLWLQLRSLLGLLLALAGQLLLAWKLSAVLLQLTPWWPLALLAAEGVFFVVWRAKKAALNEIPEQHVPEDHDGWAFFEKWHSSSHYNVKVLAIAEVRVYNSHRVVTFWIRQGCPACIAYRSCM